MMLAINSVVCARLNKMLRNMDRSCKYVVLHVRNIRLLRPNIHFGVLFELIIYNLLSYYI